VKVGTDSRDDVEVHYEDDGEGPWRRRQVSTSHSDGSSSSRGGRSCVPAGHNAAIGTTARFEGAPNRHGRDQGGVDTRAGQALEDLGVAWSRTAKRRFAGANTAWRLSAEFVAARTARRPR